MSAPTIERTSLLHRYETEFPGSRQRFEQARQLFPSGVTHDIRHLEPFPVYVERALGSHKWDVDGHELIDFFSGHGSLLLGHCHPAVVEAVQRAAGRMTHPGACHEQEIEWGQWVRKLVPSAERLRFTSSGTEATLMALRLVRIHTGKVKVLKFAGHFHGWHDFVIPASDPPYDSATVPGVPLAVQDEVVVLPPNDAEAVEKALKNDAEIGCVILEPTGGHFGAVPIRGPFLKALREITKKYDRVLIFDEVISGFRVHPGGAQGHYGVLPDLTTLAKVLAGGLPGGCLAGRADILNHIEFRAGKPKMKHPGTFNANPLSAAAGCATLQIVASGEACRRASAVGQAIRGKLNRWFAAKGIDWVTYGEFSGVKLLPKYDGPRPSDDAFTPYDGDHEKLDGPKDKKLMHAFRCGLLLQGVDAPGFSLWTSAAHSDEDVEKTVEAIGQTVALLKEEGIA